MSSREHVKWDQFTSPALWGGGGGVMVVGEGSSRTNYWQVYEVFESIDHEKRRNGSCGHFTSLSHGTTFMSLFIIPPAAYTDTEPVIPG